MQAVIPPTLANTTACYFRRAHGPQAVRLVNKTSLLEIKHSERQLEILKCCVTHLKVTNRGMQKELSALSTSFECGKPGLEP